ncbi:PKD domain-containing protein, partial [Sediminibacterium ginsengisoli]
NPVVGTGAWTQVSGPTTASFNNAAQYNTTVTGLSSGTYQFRWTISNSPCASSNDVVTVSIDPATVPGTLSSNNTVCATSNNGTINLSGYTGTIVRWESSTDNGNTWNTIANTTAAHTYNNLNTTTQFRAFVKSGVCAEAASNIVTITVDQPVIPGTLTGDNTICAGTNSGSISLSASSGNVSHWEYSTNNGSSWNIIANTGLSLTYQNLSTTTLYRALIVNGTCASVYTNIVMINVAQPVTTANAGPAQVICGSSSVMLAANQPASGTGTWISLLGPSAVSFNNNTLANATVSGLIPGQYQLAWIVSNGVCPSSISSTVITIDAATVGGTVAGSTTVCEGASGSVSLSGYTGNVTAWQTSTDLGQTWNTISNNTSVFTYTNITTTTQFRAIVQNGSCNIAYSGIAAITVNSKPDAGTLAAGNTVCVTGNQGKLQLSGYNGIISHWESSTDNGNSWSAIQHTVSEYQFNNLTNTTQYRVQVQNGVCAPAYSNPVTIATDAATVSGTLKGDAAVCAGKNNGNITLSGNTGAVMHWEVSENNGATWRVLNLQSNVYAYSDLSVTSVFRALVQNGVCAAAYSNPVTITVSQVPTQANAGADQLFCNGTQTAQLIANIPADGNGRWSMISGPANAFIVNRNLSATTVNGLRAGTYQFAWTISNGSCVASVDTVKITVDTIRAGFKLTSIFDCGKTTFNFADTTQTVSRIASWKWSLTPGDTVTTKNHNVSFTQPGDHSVSLTTTSINGCSNTIKADFKVDIYEFPKVDINMIGDACKDQLLQLTPSVNSKDSIAYMLWKLGNGVNANDMVVNAQYTSEGSYTVRLIVSTINNCFDSAYKSINIHPTPSITISKDQQICKGDTVRLTASGAVNYIWMDQNNNVVCNGCSETSIKPALSGQYKVVGYNQFGCSEVKTTSVRVIQPFRMNAIQGDTICVGQSRRLSATGASNYKWYPETGLSNTTIATPVAQPLETTTYKVIGKDNYNCFTDTAEVKIVVGRPTPFSLGKDTIVTAGNNYQLKILSGAKDIVKWRWSGSPAITCPTCPEPQIRVSEDACITCTAINIYGCASTDTVCIKTFCPATELFVPNAFSPDGDGINDLLIVQGKGIKMIRSFRIFNRWGQVVFEKSNFLPGDAASAWDGKIMGRPANADVFVYVCEVICEKGLPSIFKGNVTILK